jgi:hypothetical protein
MMVGFGLPIEFLEGLILFEIERLPSDRFLA